MCGVCGMAFLDPGRPADTEQLRRMTSIVRHRGPDSDGFHTGPGIGLGVRRLSIIDLETGDQPIASEDGSVTVVCNGEIYNYRELREELEAAGHRFRTGSDVEVIVHLWEDRGVECLGRLRGMFGLALWDARRRQLLLARDRLGIKPMHYALGDDGLYFGSEIKSILMADRVERDVDAGAIRDLFAYSFIPGPKTLFGRIRRLPAGHYLLYRAGDLSIRPYWDVSFPGAAEDGPRLSEDEWAEALLEKLVTSVRLHLRSDVPVGAWLSAGIDSSAIVALMRRLTGAPLQTFSLGFEDRQFDELGGAQTLDQFPEYDLSNHRAVCGARDFELLPKIVWHCEDPTTTGNEVARMLLSALAAERVKTVLTGEGADEVFGGYLWFRFDRLLRPLSAVPLAVRRLAAPGPLARRFPWGSRLYLAPREMNGARYKAMVGPLHSGLAESLFSDDLRARLAVGSGDEELVPAQRLQGWHPFQQLQYWELKTRLPDFIMLKLDRASMAHSLEVRVPFLDHELVEFCARIPPSLKMRGLREKHILRRALRGVLPRSIVERPKRGLATPLDAWLRGELPGFAVEPLSRERLLDTGYFRPDAVRSLLERHRAGHGRYGDLLLGVLWIQLWEELVRGGCRPARPETPAVG
jgi:asparagine synthase (glutamine-hydrolysing)